MATLTELQELLTQYETDYTAMRGRLRNRMTTDQAGYMIGTRRLDRIPIPELQTMASNLYTNIKFLRSKIDRMNGNENASVFGVVKGT